MLREEVVYAHVCFAKISSTIAVCCEYECEKYSHITFIDTTAFPKLIIITKQNWKESLSILVV